MGSQLWNFRLTLVPYCQAKTEKMKIFLAIFLLKIIVPICLSQENGIDLRARIPTCKKPKGNVGETMITGCKKLLCVRKGKKAYWAESFASSQCCSYQQDGYEIGQNITSSVTVDNCTLVTLQCGGQLDKPEIKILFDTKECQGSENYLQGYLDGQFQFVKAALERIEDWCNISTTTAPSQLTPDTTTEEGTTSPCPACSCESCSSPIPSAPVPTAAPGPELLFVGPGYMYEYTYASTEILSFPSFGSSNCTVSSEDNLPTNLRGYVATVISNGVMICGGQEGNRYPSNKCYLLTNLGYWLPSRNTDSMAMKRAFAASVHFDGGWWVIGGHDDDQYGDSPIKSTETYFKYNRTWVPSVGYPEAVYGLCAVKINETHVFSAGGRYGSGEYYGYSGSTYIYSKQTGFVEQENMTTGRSYHACSLFEDKIFVVGGHYDEYDYGSGEGGLHRVDCFSLTSLTWENIADLTPFLPFDDYGGDLSVLDGQLTYFASNGKIVNMVKVVGNSYTRYEWQVVGQMEEARKYFKVLRWNTTMCAN